MEQHTFIFKEYNSLDSFKKHLKAYLFHQAFYSFFILIYVVVRFVEF